MADSQHLFVLLESAAGYSLFDVVAMEEIGGLLDDAMNTVTDLGRFQRAVKLKAFQPFASAAEALENANAISEHAMSATLHNFLELNLPKIGKKSKSSFSLGVIDPALATAIADGLGISCRSDDTVREIIRGCRLHLETFVKGLQKGTSTKAELGLGHSYSRSKVKFNPARSDNMIIQSIALLDQLDKDVNTFAMRVREWYSWHFPELKEIVKDNIMFARAAAVIQNKNNLVQGAGEDSFKELTEKLNEICGDESMVEQVIAAAKTSMGMDCSEVDMLNIVNFTSRMVKLAEYRKQLSHYLTDKMSVVAPNLSALIGDTVAARLISKAGSLTNLAKSPASTVQILGAEKALFRALKTKGNTPKYGLIYHSTFIGRADAKNKGRISRYLANKCSIATRIDSFSDEPSRLYGEKLRDQVEERLKFYETGAAPRRNIDVMQEVSRQLKAGDGEDEKKQKMEIDDEEDEEMEDASPKKKSKKEKKKKRKSEASEGDAEEVKSAKKAKKEKKEKKKRKSKGE
mmetsp:Transcript_19584/g.42209  ORF Transcript_19584/g.42209 Transcript_19584/m.42209 type:complete len:517 (+) Transcript_19584:87-1637(+)